MIIKAALLFVSISTAISYKEVKENRPVKTKPSPAIAYFPDTVKYSISADWFSKELRFLEEPPLSAGKDKGKTCYRFSKFNSFGGTTIIRGDRINDSVYYLYHKATEVRHSSPNKAEYEIVHNVKGKVYQSLNRFPFDSLEQKLKQINFWEAPINIVWNYQGDGEMYVIEGFKNNKYHVIQRWSPKAEKNAFLNADAFMDMCNYFDELYYFY